jgi:hypothetical protein
MSHERSFALLTSAFQDWTGTTLVASGSFACITGAEPLGWIGQCQRMSYADPLAVLIDAVVHADDDAVEAACAALPTLEVTRVQRTTITNRQQRDTFERDSYQCRYAGRN